MPNIDKILDNAKKSAYFAGNNLTGLVENYAPKLKSVSGKIRLGFLFVDPGSKIGQAIEVDADSVKHIEGQSRQSQKTLLRIRDETLPDNRRDEFEIRAHKRLPFNMTLVDIEDRPNSVIIIGFYIHTSPLTQRPCAVISPKSEIYDVLLEEFNDLWQRGLGDRPLVMT